MPVPASDVVAPRTLVRLQAVGLASNLDRYITAPLLVVLAGQFHSPLAGVAAVASAHLLAYGLTQLPWAAVSRRRGSASTMRLALLGTGLAAVAAALAPSLPWLVAVRLIGGAFLGAAVPAALVFVSDELPRAHHKASFRAIVSANGVGIVLAAAIGSTSAHAEMWRIAYLVTGLVALAAGLLARGLNPRPDSPLPCDTSPIRSEAPPTAIALLMPVLLVLLEGIFIVGAVFVLPALAAHGGASPAVAGLSVAVYGLAMPLTSGSLRAAGCGGLTLRPRLMGGAALLLLAGGSLVSLGGASAALVPAFVLGVAWSLMHPALQEATSHSSSGHTTYVMAGFVTALFVGSAAGSQLFPRVLEAFGHIGVAVLCAASAPLLPTVEALTRRLHDAVSQQ